MITNNADLLLVLQNNFRYEIIDTVTTISAANEIVRKAIAGWNVSGPDNRAQVRIQKNGLLSATHGSRTNDIRRNRNIYGAPHNMEDAPTIPLARAADHTVLRAMAAKYWDCKGGSSATISAGLQDVLRALRLVAMRQSKEEGGDKSL